MQKSLFLRTLFLQILFAGWTAFAPDGGDSASIPLPSTLGSGWGSLLAETSLDKLKKQKVEAQRAIKDILSDFGGIFTSDGQLDGEKLSDLQDKAAQEMPQVKAFLENAEKDESLSSEQKEELKKLKENLDPLKFDVEVKKRQGLFRFLEWVGVLKPRVDARGLVDDKNKMATVFNKLDAFGIEPTDIDSKKLKKAIDAVEKDPELEKKLKGTISFADVADIALAKNAFLRSGNNRKDFKEKAFGGDSAKRKLYDDIDNILKRRMLANTGELLEKIEALPEGSPERAKLEQQLNDADARMLEKVESEISPKDQELVFKKLLGAVGGVGVLNEDQEFQKYLKDNNFDPNISEDDFIKFIVDGEADGDNEPDIVKRKWVDLFWNKVNELDDQKKAWEFLDGDDLKDVMKNARAREEARVKKVAEVEKESSPEPSLPTKVVDSDSIKTRSSKRSQSFSGPSKPQWVVGDDFTKPATTVPTSALEESKPEFKARRPLTAGSQPEELDEEVVKPAVLSQYLERKPISEIFDDYKKVQDSARTVQAEEKKSQEAARVKLVEQKKAKRAANKLKAEKEAREAAEAKARARLEELENTKSKLEDAKRREQELEEQVKKEKEVARNSGLMNSRALDRATTAEEQLAAARQREADLQADQASQARELEIAQRNLADNDKEYQASLAAERAKAKEVEEAAGLEKRKLQEQLDRINLQQTELDDQLTKKSSQVDQAEQRFRDSQAEVDRLKVDLESKQAGADQATEEERRQAENARAAAEKNLRQAQEKEAENAARLAELSSQENALETRKSQLDNQEQVARAAKAVNDEKAAQLERDRKALAQEQEALNKSQAEALELNNNAKQALAGAQEDADRIRREAENQAAKTKSEAEELRAKSERLRSEAKDERSKLVKEQDSFEANKKKEKVVSKIQGLVRRTQNANLQKQAADLQARTEAQAFAEKEREIKERGLAEQEADLKARTEAQVLAERERELWKRQLEEQEAALRQQEEAFERQRQEQEKQNRQEQVLAKLRAQLEEELAEKSRAGEQRLADLQRSLEKAAASPPESLPEPLYVRRQSSIPPLLEVSSPSVSTGSSSRSSRAEAERAVAEQGLRLGQSLQSPVVSPSRDVRGQYGGGWSVPSGAARAFRQGSSSDDDRENDIIELGKRRKIEEMAKEQLVENKKIADMKLREKSVENAEKIAPQSREDRERKAFEVAEATRRVKEAEKTKRDKQTAELAERARKRQYGVVERGLDKELGFSSGSGTQMGLASSKAAFRTSVPRRSSSTSSKRTRP